MSMTCYSINAHNLFQRITSLWIWRFPH